MDGCPLQLTLGLMKLFLLETSGPGQSWRNLSLLKLMKRHVLIYGLIGGILIAVLEWTEYRFLVVEHSIEIYGGLTAAMFAAIGIWLGLKLTGKQHRIVVKEVSVAVRVPFIPDEKKREELGITRRELEILERIAQGMSNREIAGRR
jgi:NarL family two-component system response regulator LiaR